MLQKLTVKPFFIFLLVEFTKKSNHENKKVSIQY